MHALSFSRLSGDSSLPEGASHAARSWCVDGTLVASLPSPAGKVPSVREADEERRESKVFALTFGNGQNFVLLIHHLRWSPFPAGEGYVCCNNTGGGLLL